MLSGNKACNRSSENSSKIAVKVPSSVFRISGSCAWSFERTLFSLAVEPVDVMSLQKDLHVS